MRKIISLILCIAVCFSMSVPAFATTTNDYDVDTQKLVESRDVTTTYWFRLTEVRSGNYDNAFSVQKNGLLPIRRIYANAGFKFGDGVERTVNVQIGDKSFDIVADGTVYQLGNWNINTDIPIIIAIRNVPSICSSVVSVYSID